MQVQVRVLLKGDRKTNPKRETPVWSKLDELATGTEQRGRELDQKP